jgi:hypothetical protein
MPPAVTTTWQDYSQGRYSETEPLLQKALELSSTLSIFDLIRQRKQQYLSNAG